MTRTIAIETPRLILREIDAGDLDFVAEMLGHAEVMRLLPSRLTRVESEEWVRRQQDRYARDGHGYWLAVDRATGEPVGQAGVMWATVEGVDELSVGYILHRPYWGRGLATEAARASCDYVFDTLGAARAITLIRPENLASLAVARRIGMSIERRTIYARYEHFVLALTRSAREGKHVPTD